MQHRSSDLAKRVSTRKDKLGMSEAALAAAAGMSRSTLSRFLRGATRNPRLSTIKNLARALQAPLEDLIGARQLELIGDSESLKQISAGLKDVLAEQFDAVPRHLQGDAANDAAEAMVLVLLKTGRRPTPELYRHLS